MMTLRSFAPALDRALALNHELNRVFREGGSDALFWVPAMDVVEKTDAYLVVCDLPGVHPEHVEIQFEHNTLTIRGTKAPTLQATNGDEFRVYTAERVSGGFERAVRLPEYVEGDRIEASYDNGVLTITVPKSQAALPRRIAIKGAERHTDEQATRPNA